MSTTTTLELIPNQREKVRSFFAKREDYQAFYRRFNDNVKTDLERLRRARQLSEESAKKRRIG
jgi:hypothetical protein